MCKKTLKEDEYFIDIYTNNIEININFGSMDSKKFKVYWFAMIKVYQKSSLDGFSCLWNKFVESL